MAGYRSVDAEDAEEKRENTKTRKAGNTYQIAEISANFP
jgi:hypothetical protein